MFTWSLLAEVCVMIVIIDTIGEVEWLRTVVLVASMTSFLVSSVTFNTSVTHNASADASNSSNTSMAANSTNTSMTADGSNSSMASNAADAISVTTDAAM